LNYTKETSILTNEYMGYFNTWNRLGSIANMIDLFRIGFNFPFFFFYKILCVQICS